jgi:sulfotransferase family protein
MKLPNFFIVGAPKAGTTSLYNYLGQHPQIYMSPLKEPNYFAAEMRFENFVAEARPRIAEEMRALQEYLRGNMRQKRFGGLVSTWEDYLRLFGNVADEIAIGEATPCYLWSETAARNIAARIPGAKIIINLRNPVDRAFSQYLHMLTVGATRRSFRDQIHANLSCETRLLGPLRPLLEYGFYNEQVSRYLEAFPASQIHISFYEELQRAPERLLTALFSFLGVDPSFAPDLSLRYTEPRIPKLLGTAYFLRKWRIWPYLRKLTPQPLVSRLSSLMLRERASLTMAAADRAFLTEYYRDDIEKLARLLNCDLSAWLDSSSHEVQGRIASLGTINQLPKRL